MAAAGLSGCGGVRRGAHLTVWVTGSSENSWMTEEGKRRDGGPSGSFSIVKQGVLVN